MYNRCIKRLIDFIIAILVLPFLLVIIIIVAPIIIIDDPGPVFYISRRAGYKGKIFGMLKFRSMKVGSPDIRNADGSTFNSGDDPRQTRIGKVLRKTSIDELPQFLNVLVGQMAIIGPRPVLESQVATFSEDEMAKLNVLPGITGYTQAYYRNQLPTHEERMRDAWYAQHLSFCLDVKIFLKTIDTVVHTNRVYRN